MSREPRICSPRYRGKLLVPDFTHTTVTSGFGTGTTTVTTGRASDGSFVHIVSACGKRDNGEHDQIKRFFGGGTLV